MADPNPNPTQQMIVEGAEETKGPPGEEYEEIREQVRRQSSSRVRSVEAPSIRRCFSRMIERRTDVFPIMRLSGVDDEETHAGETTVLLQPSSTLTFRVASFVLQDRYLPIANIARIMKNTLPGT
jgi:hypothetical protein